MIAFSIFKLLIYAGLVLFVCYYFFYKVILKLAERRRIQTKVSAQKQLLLTVKR